jgi:hypothetical protein
MACAELLDGGTYLGQVVQAVQIVRIPELNQIPGLQKTTLKPSTTPRISQNRALWQPSPANICLSSEISSE